MLMLSPTMLSRWLSTRPDDVRAFIDAGDPPAGEDDGLLAALEAASSAGETPFAELPALLASHPAGTRALGRLGRVRLLAWVADGAGDAYGTVVQAITEIGGAQDGEAEDGGEGSPAGSGALGVLFLEDLIQLAKSVVGPRVASRLAARPGLEAAVEAAASVEEDMAYRGGGI